MFVLFFRDAIALEIHGVQSGRLRLESKVSALGKTDTVRRNVKTVETPALRVSTASRKICESVGSPPENRTLTSR